MELSIHVIAIFLRYRAVWVNRYPTHNARSDPRRVSRRIPRNSVDKLDSYRKP